MATDVLRVPIAEAANRLGFSVKTLMRRAAEGRIQVVKDGTRRYVPEASLRAYAEAAAPGRDTVDWTGLPDLRVLFRIPELEERQRAKEAAGRNGDPTAARAGR